MSFRVLFALIFCNVVWSVNPAMGKLVLLHFPAPQAAWLRYGTAFLSYFLSVQALRLRPEAWRRAPRAFMVPQGPSRWADGGVLLLLGFSTFCFSSLLQMIGLSASRATDNALIVAMEPLLSVLLAWVFLRERLSRAAIGAFVLALAGFALLTGLTPGRLSHGWDPHLVGNLILLLSIVGDAVYSLAGRRLVRSYSPASVFGSSLAVGVALLTLVTAWISGLPSMAALKGMPWQSWLGIIWVGPLGTAFTYLIWMMALSRAPVASVALTLFVQPVLGPVWGALFLGERLTTAQAMGSILILAAVFGQFWASLRARSS